VFEKRALYMGEGALEAGFDESKTGL